MSEEKCHASGCDKPARMAIITNRPTREDLYSKVFYDNRDPKVPKKALHYCKKHGVATIAELAAVLTDD